MPTIQRPLKTYGTRKYVDEVAAAPGNYDPILANEVDADLDTVYTAWNNTLASGIYWTVSGISLTPIDATQRLNIPGPTTAEATDQAALVFGQRTIKGRLAALPGFDVAYLMSNIRYTGTTWAQDDAVKSSWQLGLDPQSDFARFLRSAPGGQPVELLKLDGAGNLTMTGSLAVNGSNHVFKPATGATAFWLLGTGALGATIAAQQSNGTTAVPTVTTTGNIILQLSAYGYVSGAYQERAVMRSTAAENWTASAQGTNWIFYVTPNGTTAALSQYFLVDGSANIQITGAVAIKATGTTWANPSDRRLKDEIADYTTGLPAILALQPRTFVYNGKGGSLAGMRGYGFIADEVLPVMPETVGVRAGKLDPADEADTDIQTLDQSNLILALVNATKELAARVSALEVR